MSKKNNDNPRFYPLRAPENSFKVSFTPLTEEQYHSSTWRSDEFGTRESQSLHVPSLFSMEVRCASRFVRVPRSRYSFSWPVTVLSATTFWTVDLLWTILR